MGFTVVKEEDVAIGNNYFMNDYVMEIKVPEAELGYKAWVCAGFSLSHRGTFHFMGRLMTQVFFNAIFH